MADARQTLYRHWLLLQSLPKAPRALSASALTARLSEEGFRVSKRSVERDLQSLSTVFPLLCDDSSTPFLWSWSKDAPSFSLPGMSPLQALVLLTAQEHLRDLLPQGQLGQLAPLFEQARQTITQQHSRPGLGVWAQTVAVVPAVQPTLPPDTDPALLETLQDALLDQRVVEVGYRSRVAGERKQFNVHPIGFLQRARVMYLACTINDYTDVRLLAAHRIDAARLLDQPCRKHSPEEIQQARTLVEAGFSDRGRIAMTLRMHPFPAEALAESPLSRDQRISPCDGEGWVEINATVSDTDQLRWWLTSFGEKVEVVAPVELRTWVAERHRLACQRYAPAS